MVEINVAAIIPPSTITPMDLIVIAPAPVATASGITPKTKERMVIMMALKRDLAAYRAASFIGTPSSRCSLATSTIRMAFLDDRPISRTRPIWANRLLSRPARF